MGCIFVAYSIHVQKYTKSLVFYVTFHIDIVFIQKVIYQSYISCLNLQDNL